MPCKANPAQVPEKTFAGGLDTQTAFCDRAGHGMKTTTKTDRRALLAALLIAALAVLVAALVGLAEEAAGFPINH